MGRTIINVKVEDVEKRRQPNKHYVYVICVTWSDEAVTVIYRRYSQFFSLQNKLLDKFPVEGGDWDPSERIIPFLPGKILFGRSHIRRVALDRLDMIGKYCSSLVQLPDHISESKEVLDFFETHPEDIRQYEKERSPVRHGPVANKISNPLLLEQYMAVDDYTADGPNETSLTGGALVEVVEKAETGWWFVSTEDGRGWVPSSYLETYDGEQEDRILQKANQGHGEKFICCHSYSAQQGDELSMEKGAYVEVLERNLDGWWLVRINDKEGRVPGTYLTRTDTLKAKRLIGLKAQPKVEIIPNIMAISNLSKKQKPDTVPSSAPVALVAVSGNRVTKSQCYKPAKPPGPPLAEPRSNNPSRPLPPTSDAQPRPVQVLPTSSAAACAGGGDLTVSNESISSWTSSEDSTDSIGPTRIPPRRDVVSEADARRERTPSMTGDCLFEVHTAYCSNIPDGLTVTPGQRLKLLERASNGWWFFQSETDDGWVPAAYVQQISNTKPKAKPQRPPPPKFSRNPQSLPLQEPIVESNRLYSNIDTIDTSSSTLNNDTDNLRADVGTVKPSSVNSVKLDVADGMPQNRSQGSVSRPQQESVSRSQQESVSRPQPPRSPKPSLPMKPTGIKPALPKKPSLAAKPKVSNVCEEQQPNAVKVQQMKSRFE